MRGKGDNTMPYGTYAGGLVGAIILVVLVVLAMKALGLV